MDTMMSTATDWMLPVMVLATVACAVVSGLLGMRLLQAVRKGWDDGVDPRMPSLQEDNLPSTGGTVPRRGMRLDPRTKLAAMAAMAVAVALAPNRPTRPCSWPSRPLRAVEGLGPRGHGHRPHVAFLRALGRMRERRGPCARCSPRFPAGSPGVRALMAPRHRGTHHVNELMSALARMGCRAVTIP